MKKLKRPEILVFLTILVNVNCLFGQQKDVRYLAPYVAIDVPNPPHEVESYAEKGTTRCGATNHGTINLVDCDDIGTAAFNSAGITASVDDENVDATGHPCGPQGGGVQPGSWHVFDLATGVESLLIEYAGGFAGAGGFSQLWMSAYQGPNCSSLTNVGCGQIIDKSGPNLVLLSLGLDNLDDTQNLWIFVWGDKGYDIDFTFTGTSPAPSNTSCANAISNTEACNLGATGATFTAPSSALGAGACAGGTWYSNENTVFYTFTATDADGSIDIDNIICNDGTMGEAQFGVWRSCAAVGTYGANFLGCAVGTSSLSLSPLVPGQTYIIAVDGQAGDVCTWTFTVDGIALPTEVYGFDSKRIDRTTVELTWKTATELNTDYFSVERSDDGFNFYEIGNVQAAGYANESHAYTFKDQEAVTNNRYIYYRLKVVDFDGKFNLYGPRFVSSSDEVLNEAVIVPNPADNQCIVSFTSEKNASYTLQLADQYGRLVTQEEGVSSQGLKTEVYLELNGLDSGVYFVTIVNQKEGKQQVVKFIKK